MKLLTVEQIAAVAGGTSVVPADSMGPRYQDRNILQDELLRYKTGLPNAFGTNPDQQLPGG